MKILVPTDFSTCADDAFQKALEIAKATSGHIFLYHCAAIPDGWENLPVEVKYKDKLNKYLALAAKDQLVDRRNIAENQGIPCDILYSGGKFLKEIKQQVDKADYDLIVMGSHGASGKEEWFIGSNTQKVIRGLHHSILVVKNEQYPGTFKKVVFATGLNNEDQEPFQRFLTFMDHFEEAEIHLLAVNISSIFQLPDMLNEEAMKIFVDLAVNREIKTHLYPDYSVESGVRHFSREHKVDLIAISNHNRHPIKRIFQGSNVEMIANHSDIPVLSIDY